MADSDRWLMPYDQQHPLPSAQEMANQGLARAEDLKIRSELAQFATEKIHETAQHQRHNLANSAAQIRGYIDSLPDDSLANIEAAALQSHWVGEARAYNSILESLGRNAEYTIRQRFEPKKRKLFGR